MAKGGLAKRFSIIFIIAAFAAAASIIAWKFGSEMIFIAAVIAGFAAVSIGAAAAMRSVQNSLGRLTDRVEACAKGGEPRFETDDSGEFGKLEGAISRFAAANEKFACEISLLAERHRSGEIAASLNEKDYEGKLRTAVAGINKAVKAHGGEFVELKTFISQLGRGNLSAKLNAMPGAKRQMSDEAENLRETLKAFCQKIIRASEAMSCGVFDSRPSENNFSGDFARAASTQDASAGTLGKALDEITLALSATAQCDFTRTAAGGARGALVPVRNAAAEINMRFGDYARDIANALNSIERGAAPSKEYVGAFAPVKEALLRVSKEYKSIASASKPSFIANARPLQRPARDISAAPAETKKPAPSGPNQFISASPQLHKQTLVAPSAAHVYDAKDFGKY